MDELHRKSDGQIQQGDSDGREAPREGVRQGQQRVMTNVGRQREAWQARQNAQGALQDPRMGQAGQADQGGIGQSAPQQPARTRQGQPSQDAFAQSGVQPRHGRPRAQQPQGQQRVMTNVGRQREAWQARQNGQNGQGGQGAAQNPAPMGSDARFQPAAALDAAGDASAVARKSSPLKRGKLLKIIIAVAAVLVVAVVGWLVYDNVTANPNMAPEGQQVTIDVPQGSFGSDIAQILYDAGLLRHLDDFAKRVDKRQVGHLLQAGRYTLTGGMDLDAIIDSLIKGPGLSGDRCTIPEGSTLKETAALVEQATNGRITSDAFIEAARDATPYAQSHPELAAVGAKGLEGFLFPETYGITEDMEAADVVAMMVDQFFVRFADLDLSFAQSRGLDLYGFVTLASIVQGEGSPDSFADIACVFYNRLNINMALESDATTAYEVGREPTAAEVHANTPYSTYTHAGLTPTPICSPSYEAMAGTASPASTGNFYFFSVLDAEGVPTYYFNETYEGHEADIDRYMR